jgi:ubiquinone/menaquinone biosynthesis C-methylase UbiE
VTVDRDALRDAYDRQAADYGRARNAQYDRFRDSMLDWFAAAVAPVGTAVVDLGSGPGHEAVMLRDRGLDPLAVDFSPAMVQRCRKRGIDATVADLHALDLPAASYAGAWASFSLLHIAKRDLSDVLKRVRHVLCPGGVLLVLLFEGTGEGLRQEDVKRFGVARHFAYYSLAELRGAIADQFSIVAEWRLDISPRPTLAVAGQVSGDHRNGESPHGYHHLSSTC